MATARQATKWTMMATMTTVATDDDKDDGDGYYYPGYYAHFILNWKKM
jgi:hypothetical protein